MPSSPYIRRDIYGNAMVQDNELTAQNPEAHGHLILSIFPNPFLSYAVILYSIPASDGNAKLDIFDGLGRNIETIPLNCIQTELTLNANGLKPGLYYYTLTTTNNKLTGKFVVANP